MHHDHDIATFRGLRSRREFLRTSMLGAAAAWTLPAFLERTFAAMDLKAASAVVQTPTGKDSPILVVVQLAGGNDGLNTVIPHGMDAYYRVRPDIAIPASSALKLDDLHALHPRLKGLRALYDDGALGIVQGVGYPNPNRSHFRSTEIWATGSDAESNEVYGWIGRYFDSCCKGADPTVGVAVGGETPQAFASPRPTGVSFRDPERYRWDGTGTEDEVFRSLNRPDEPGDDSAGGSSVSMIGGAIRSELSSLDFLQRTALDAQLSSDRILEISRKSKSSTDFPRSPLAESLRLIARMIGGGLPTRVYYASQGGYDTHTNQSGTHDRLLGDLDAALFAFCKEMKAQGNFGRVLLMTFSEFGRRVAQNGSAGTDHGAAAPLFVMGGHVAGGLHGAHPSLDDLTSGDLKFHTDFRSIYSTILSSWLQASPKQILGRDFPSLPLLKQT